MISQRTSGLRAVLALCQMGLTACLFWAEFLILLAAMGDKTFWHSYAAYCSATAAWTPPRSSAAISSTRTA